MSTAFAGPPPNFAPAEGEGRYSKQLAEMEDRFRSTRRQIDGWRNVALILGGIAVIDHSRERLLRRRPSDRGACG